MKRRSRFVEDQIISVRSGQPAGAKAADLCREHRICDTTFYILKAKCGGLSGSDARGGDGRSGCASCHRQRPRLGRLISFALNRINGGNSQADARQRPGRDPPFGAARGKECNLDRREAEGRRVASSATEILTPIAVFCIDSEHRPLPSSPRCFCADRLVTRAQI